MNKIPLYSPQGKLIYYYVLFKDKLKRIYFSMASVSYKYTPVICEGSGYGYISGVREREQEVINAAFKLGILRVPMRDQTMHYAYFGQLNFGYLLYGNHSYIIGFNKFLNTSIFHKPIMEREKGHIQYLWELVNKTLQQPSYYSSWWTKGMLDDSQVPYIEWYKGCVPTSIAMITGYLHNYGFSKFPNINHIVHSDGYDGWIDDSHASEVIEFLVDHWHLNRDNKYAVHFWDIEDGVWALIRHYGYIPSHNMVYGDIETIYRGGWNRLAWNDYGAIVDGIKRWNMPSFVGLMYSSKYGNHGVAAMGYKYHADLWGWHDKRLFIHDTWLHLDESGNWIVNYLVEYHVDGDFPWWNPAAHYDVLNFYPLTE